MNKALVVDVLMEVLSERERQHVKWGEQNHPNGTGDHYRSEADELRAVCDEVFTAGEGTWADILLEEVYEALAEADPVKLRAELVQTAAVAAAWVEAIDRRLAKENA